MRIYLSTFILSFCALLCPQLHAQDGGTGASPFLPDLEKARPINGINPKDAARFWLNWQLVTVRFRNDNKEQRFIYANQVAWQAMQAGRPTYPEGSMFAKVAFRTTEDQAFPSSVEPNNFTRIQIMKKDERQYAETNGWGYAIYLPESQSNSNPKQDNEMAKACHACHILVKARDYVFARSPFMNAEIGGAGDKSIAFADQFQIAKKADLPPYAKAILKVFPAATDETKFRSMNLFVGSVNESILPVVRSVAQSGLTHLIFDDKSRRFIGGEKLAATPACKSLIRVGVTQEFSVPKPMVQLRFAKVCDGVVQWDEIADLPAGLR